MHFSLLIQGAIITQFCREKKPRLDQTSVQKKPAPQKLPGIISPIPTIEMSPGEDEFSFAQHNKLLRSEYKKQHLNEVLVKDLMDHSFAMRRCDITKTGYSGVADLFVAYPFLQDCKQVSVMYCS